MNAHDQHLEARRLAELADRKRRAHEWFARFSRKLPDLLAEAAATGRRSLELSWSGKDAVVPFDFHYDLNAPDSPLHLWCNERGLTLNTSGYHRGQDHWLIYFEKLPP